MSNEIKNKIESCGICSKYAPVQRQQPLQYIEIPNYPFEIISMDVFQIKHEYFLVTVDHYSDFIELDKILDLTPRSVIACCKHNFARHGIPRMIITDNATNFNNKMMMDFVTNWNINHLKSAPYMHQSNGKAESAVKIMKKLILKVRESKEDLWLAILQQRNTPNKLNTSPCQRLFSRKTRSLIPVLDKGYKPEIVEDVSRKIEEHKLNTKKYFDVGTRALKDLKENQMVFSKINPDTDKTWKKGYVKEKISDRSYIVVINGKEYRRDRKHILCRGQDEFNNKNNNNSLFTDSNDINEEISYFNIEVQPRSSLAVTGSQIAPEEHNDRSGLAVNGSQIAPEKLSVEEQDVDEENIEDPSTSSSVPRRSERLKDKLRINYFN